MAAGLPVICFDYGGQTDFLKSDKTGYLIKLNDGTAFLNACNKLIDREDIRHQMGNHNLNAVEDFYIDHCAEQYEKLYDKVIESYINC